MIFVILIGTAWFVLSWERRTARNFGGAAYMTLLVFSIVMLYAVMATAQRQKQTADLYPVVAHHQEKHYTP